MAGDKGRSRRRGRGSGMRWWPILVVALLSAACTPAGDTSATGVEDTTTTPPVATSEADATGDTQEADPTPLVESRLETVAGGRVLDADVDGPSEALVVLQDDPFVGVARYPRPEYEANPWSQWGQGAILPDGRVITAIGDHLGADGNSFLFVYDPETQALTRFADVLSTLDHEPGSWGYGKVHGQMVDAGDGGIYFTTYYGSRRGLTFDGSYEGDVLFRLDATTLALQPVAVPVAGHGVPSLASNGAGQIYGEAVDPLADDDVYPSGGFFVFDTTTGSTEHVRLDPDHAGFRNIMVQSDGTPLFGQAGGGLQRFTDGSVTEVDGVSLPAELRASATAGDGTVYGVTGDPFAIFAYEPDGTTRDLGRALYYVTTVALVPDESELLYVPGAHGDSHLWGSPLVSVDVASGQQEEIVRLYDLVREATGLVLGGTYSINVDPERNVAYIGFNAGETEDSPWGEVLFVVVELP